MLQKIRNILEEYVDVSKEQITMETNLLSDMGLSSLVVVNMIDAFEDEIGIEILNRSVRQSEIGSRQINLLILVIFSQTSLCPADCQRDL